MSIVSCTKAIVQFSTSIQASYQGHTFKLHVPFSRRAEDRKLTSLLLQLCYESSKNATRTWMSCGGKRRKFHRVATFA
ncbi:hypothetical protein V6N12_048106 [Hibiscus sabdariffa]|uniref:Uncharacterized protein n=1 Tax=Hibiscus sabdariffa TaxID=183260 RepID=A0ABR2CVN4_9ROSI